MADHYKPGDPVLDAGCSQQKLDAVSHGGGGSGIETYLFMQESERGSRMIRCRCLCTLR